MLSFRKKREGYIMYKTLSDKMKTTSNRRVFNPQTGETLDDSFKKLSITDRMEFLIEKGYKSENCGYITRIFK